MIVYIIIYNIYRMTSPILMGIHETCKFWDDSLSCIDSVKREFGSAGPGPSPYCQSSRVFVVSDAIDSANFWVAPTLWHFHLHHHLHTSECVERQHVSWFVNADEEQQGNHVFKELKTVKLCMQNLSQYHLDMRQAVHCYSAQANSTWTHLFGLINWTKTSINV